jgi:hypothetical protein
MSVSVSIVMRSRANCAAASKSVAFIASAFVHPAKEF